MITDELLVICDECWLIGDEWWMLNTQTSLWEHVGVHLRPWVIVMLFLTVFLTYFLTVFLQNFYHISAVLCYCCNFCSRDCVQGQDDGWVRSGADFLPLGTDHSFDTKIWTRRREGSCVNVFLLNLLLLSGCEGQNMKAFEAGRRVEFFRFWKGWEGGMCAPLWAGSPPYLDFVSLIKSEGWKNYWTLAALHSLTGPRKP